MIVTKTILKAIMPNIESNIKKNPSFEGYSLQNIVDTINKYAPSFGITTKLRMQHFLAQIATECGEFRSTTENLNYSSDGLLKTFSKYFTKEQANAYARQPEKIANRVYANRMGNGNEASGEGWKYRGRGCIQITGKSNYQAYDNYLKERGVNANLLEAPELISKPLGAIKSAMWYWWKHNLNIYADRDSILSVTKAINGGTNGLVERKKYLAKAKLYVS